MGKPYNLDRATAVKQRLRNILPRYPKSAGGSVSYRYKAGHFAKVMIDTGISHGLRIPNNTSNARASVNRVLDGGGAETWVLDLMELAATRYEGGDFKLDSQPELDEAPADDVSPENYEHYLKRNNSEAARGLRELDEREHSFYTERQEVAPTTLGSVIAEIDARLSNLTMDEANRVLAALDALYQR